MGAFKVLLEVAAAGLVYLAWRCLAPDGDTLLAGPVAPFIPYIGSAIAGWAGKKLAGGGGSSSGSGGSSEAPSAANNWGYPYTLEPYTDIPDQWLDYYSPNAIGDVGTALEEQVGPFVTASGQNYNWADQWNSRAAQAEADARNLWNIAQSYAPQAQQWFDKSGQIVDQSMPWFERGMQYTQEAEPWLTRGMQYTEQAEPWFTRAGEVTAQAQPFFEQAGGMMERAEPWFGRAATTADETAPWFTRAGTAFDQAMGAIDPAQAYYEAVLKGGPEANAAISSQLAALTGQLAQQKEALPQTVAGDMARYLLGAQGASSAAGLLGAARGAAPAGLLQTAQQRGQLGAAAGEMGTGIGNLALGYLQGGGNLASLIPQLASAGGTIGNLGLGMGNLGTNIAGLAPTLAQAGVNIAGLAPSMAQGGGVLGNLGLGVGQMGRTIGDYGLGLGNLGTNIGDFSTRAGGLSQGFGELQSGNLLRAAQIRQMGGNMLSDAARLALERGGQLTQAQLEARRQNIGQGQNLADWLLKQKEIEAMGRSGKWKVLGDLAGNLGGPVLKWGLGKWG